MYTIHYLARYIPIGIGQLKASEHDYFVVFLIVQISGCDTKLSMASIVSS